MDMGKLGKVLVLVHGAVSIALLAWAIGIYTQRVKWTSTDKSDPGVFDQHTVRAAELQSGVEKSYTRWSGNLFTVLNLDNERFNRRGFYPGQLNMLVTGQFGGMDVPNPVQELVNGPNGYLDIRQPTGRPAMQSSGQNLRNITQYYTLMQQQYVAFDMSQKKSRQYQADREELNKKIVGTEGPPPTKGLRLLLTEQRTMEDAAVAQERYDTTYLVNLEAEFGLLKKRRDALTVRMKELDTGR
jgi:hypothetical protein